MSALVAAPTAPAAADNEVMMLSVQVKEEVVRLALPSRERTTAAEVVGLLLSAAANKHQQQHELLVGKRIRLIFSGRVLASSDLISLVVPLGAVVHCAVQDFPSSTSTTTTTTTPDDDDDDDDEIAEDDDDEEAARSHRQRRRQHRSVLRRLAASSTPARTTAATTTVQLDSSSSSTRGADFVVGFAMGFAVGPLMCFWLLERAPTAQKVGILAGIVASSLLREYHELALFAVDQSSSHAAAAAVTLNEPTLPLLPVNSFELG